MTIYDLYPDEPEEELIECLSCGWYGSPDELICVHYAQMHLESCPCCGVDEFLYVGYNA